jgi:hypothetical protein
MTIDVLSPTPGAISAALLAWSTALFVQIIKSNFCSASATDLSTIEQVSKACDECVSILAFMGLHMMFSVIFTLNLDTVGSNSCEIGPRNNSQTNTLTATENEGVERANPLYCLSLRCSGCEVQLTLQVHRPILPKCRYSF